HPIVLVLEDLHWGDLPTVTLVDAVLRLFPERPLFVLALSRPEADASFPGLCSERGVQRMALAGLTRKAASRLARTVLGDAVGEAQLAELVDRAAGNAF